MPNFAPSPVKRYPPLLFRFTSPFKNLCFKLNVVLFIYLFIYFRLNKSFWYQTRLVHLPFYNNQTQITNIAPYRSKTLRFNTSRTHTSTPTTPTMTSWSKCSLPSLRVLGLTSTPKPCGTSSPETSPTKRYRLSLTTLFLTSSTMTLPPSFPSSVTTRFPMLLSPPPQLPPLPSCSSSNSSCLAVLASFVWYRCRFLWVPLTMSLMGPRLSSLPKWWVFEFWVWLYSNRLCFEGY